MAGPKLTNTVVDLYAPVASLDAYLLLGNGGTRTLCGYFVDHHGEQVGVSFTGTVDVTTPKTLATLAGITLDPTAVGVVLSISGDTYISLGAKVSAVVTDMAANPTKYPSLTLSKLTKLGRIN